MKCFLVVLLVVLSAPLLAQLNVTEKFQKITTIAQAQEYVKANPELKPAILELNYGKDTTLIDKRLLRQKQGDVFSVGYYTYKVLESTEARTLRAAYIFLDGGTLQPAEVDSLKKVIVQKANAGEPWGKLSDQYTMDGNKTKGDTDWFYGPYTFPEEFQNAVINHKLGEIFFVDVAEKQWHYIVKKTHDDRITKDMTILKSNGR